MKFLRIEYGPTRNVAIMEEDGKETVWDRPALALRILATRDHSEEDKALAMLNSTQGAVEVKVKPTAWLVQVEAECDGDERPFTAHGEPLMVYGAAEPFDAKLRALIEGDDSLGVTARPACGEVGPWHGMACVRWPHLHHDEGGGLLHHQGAVLGQNQFRTLDMAALRRAVEALVRLYGRDAVMRPLWSDIRTVAMGEQSARKTLLEAKVALATEHAAAMKVLNHVEHDEVAGQEGYVTGLWKALRVLGVEPLSEMEEPPDEPRDGPEWEPDDQPEPDEGGEAEARG